MSLPVVYFVSRRGSPLLIGILSKAPLKSDRLPILYSSGPGEENNAENENGLANGWSNLKREGSSVPIEYFFASDAR